MGDDKDKDIWVSEETTDSVSTTATQTGYSDLRMFELKGNVKECITYSYYNISLNNNEPVVDTAIVKPRVTRLYFDRMGGYVKAADELIKRDDHGRIIYWRDRRPNAKGVHPGMLRDTLHYRHVNDNIIESSGMGEEAVTVYDNDGKIVGMCSEPGVKDSGMSAFNIYRHFDSQNNWVERVTVWTTRSSGGMPHVSYSLDRRTITYYSPE